ncbi:MAG: hypothetical protein WC744_05170 [Patescibacteria group bacterium]|jgi:hypothetical protein
MSNLVNNFINYLYLKERSRVETSRIVSEVTYSTVLELYSEKYSDESSAQKLEKDLTELFNQNVSKDKIYEKLGISPVMMRKRLEKNIVRYIKFNQ